MAQIVAGNPIPIPVPSPILLSSLYPPPARLVELGIGVDVDVIELLGWVGELEGSGILISTECL